MPISASAWLAGADVGSPWRRLYWTLPLALVICAATLWLFSYFMAQPAPVTPASLPVDAQLVEMAPPAPATAPPRARTPPPPEPAAPPQPSPEAQPLAQPPRPKEAAPAQAPATAPAKAVPPAAPAIPNQGAQPVARPMPAIPDDLREDAMNEAATARFHIAPDGSATVELIKPTENPRLNRFLLDALGRWKFNPAIQDGKPVASVVDIVIHVDVE